MPTKVHLVKAMVFPVVMYECESWTIKKAEHWRIDAFELWILRVLWTERRSNQYILKETSSENPLEGWCWSWNSNTLSTWCKELTPWKRPWYEEKLKAGEGDKRGWDVWMSSPTWTWVWAGYRSLWWTGKPSVPQSMAHKETDMTEWRNWTDRFWVVFSLLFISRNFFTSLLISSVTYSLLRNTLISMSLCFLQFFFSCNWYLVSHCCGRRRCLIQFQFS